MYLLTIRRYNMKKLVVLLLASLVATSALAVVDPDPNSIGIYFDLNADDNCYFVGPSVPFFAYLILTNTDAPLVSGYEVGYEFTGPGPGQLFRLSSLIANGAVDGLDLGNSADPMVGDHIVGLASPLVTSEATVLHAWQLMLLAEVGMEMKIGPIISGEPSIPGPYPVVLNADTQTLFQAFQSSGDPLLPVATVNIIDCVVGVEEASFGSVKSLYR
jgi:hypothetical protein